MPTMCRNLRSNRASYKESGFIGNGQYRLCETDNVVKNDVTG